MSEDIQVNFVLRHGYEQEECSEEMQQAFAACEQLRTGGLKARWLHENDHIELQNLTKKNVFVLENFDGPVFEKLKSTKCLLVGPRCLSCCLLEGTPIPSGPDPVFTVAMRGLIITASGMTKLEKERIKERIHWMGGLYINQLTTDTTHLVSNTVLSDKYMKSVALGIPVMNVTWLTDVWDVSLRMNVNGNSSEFDKHRLQPFTNLHVTTAGIPKKEKQVIIKLVTENGGTFTGAFLSESTDIVVMTQDNIGSEKYKAAMEFGKVCVHPTWIHHSAERGAAQPLAKYKVTGALTSSPLAHHNLPDMSLNFSRITGSRPTSNVVNETTDNSVIASGRSKLSLEVKRSNESQSVDKDILAAFEKFDMNSVKKAGPIFDGFFVWVVGGSGICRERACGLVSRAGGVRYDCPGPRVTHAVSMSATAAARAATELPSVPVVSALWLIKSLEAGKALDVTEYLLNDGASTSSGCTNKSRVEPASPLSKKNLQMLRPPCPPPMFTDGDMAKVQDDVLQQYKNSTLSTSSKSDGCREAAPESTGVSEAGDEPTQEQEQIFEGVRFEVESLDEDTLCDIGAEVTAAGGVFVAVGAGGSHVLVPLDFDVDELPNKDVEPVTVFWVRDCLTQQELVPIQYHHRPVRVANSTALKGVVLSLSTYSGVERAFLDELATLLGATTQLRFCRRAAGDALASTHLLCPEPTGDKYAGAVRWGLPAVTASWLIDCAAAGRRLYEEPYLVGDTKAPPLPETSEETKDSASDKENAEGVEKAKTTNSTISCREDSRERTPQNKRVDNVQAEMANVEAEMSPASRYIAMDRQGLLNADSQQTPKRVLQKEQQGGIEAAVRTPPLDEALSTPNLAALSPTTRRRIQAVRRGEMPSDPIRTPNNPFEGGPATPDSSFGAALRPGSGLSPGSRKRLWRQVQHLPSKQPSLVTHKHTPLSEIRNRFLAQYAQAVPTPPADHANIAPRKLQLQDQLDTPPPKVAKLVSDQSPANATADKTPSTSNKESKKCEDKSATISDSVDSQLRRLSAVLTGGSSTPAHLRLRRQKSLTPTADAIATAADSEIEEPMSQANAVRWDDGESQVPTADGSPASAPAPDSAPILPVKRFMLSNNVDNQAELTEIILSLGGEVCSGNELDPNATHLLCAAPVRSEKMLGTVAAGKWALHPAYIIRSKINGTFLPEEEFEWGNPRAFSLPSLSELEQTVARAAHRWRVARNASLPGPFAGLKTLLHMPPPRRRLLAKLLRAGDGDVIDDAPPYSADDANLCLADFRRYPISDRDAQWLRDRRVPVCPYILLFSYLTEETPPNPREHCLPDFKLK